MNKKERRKQLAQRIHIDIPDSKQCSKCRITKSSSDFVRSRREFDGLETYCKICSNEVKRRSYDRKVAAHRADPPPIPDCKQCGHCKMIKSKDWFQRHAASNDGLGAFCKPCKSITEREHRKRQRADDPRRVFFKRLSGKLKARNRRRGVDHTDITLEWLLEMYGHLTHCPRMGIEFDWQSCGRMNDATPSLDRIDPSGLYMRDNVELVCWIYNKAKSNLTPGMLATFARSVVSQSLV